MSHTKNKPHKKSCVVCGNEFTAWLTTDKYCKYSCFLTDLKNAKVSRKQNPRSAARIRSKSAARKRDNANCRLQGHLPPDLDHSMHRRNTQVHHIIFLSEGGPDRQWNLITLCEYCHHNIAHKFKNDWQGQLLEIINGSEWLESIEEQDGPWMQSHTLKVPAYVQTLRSIWSDRTANTPYSRDSFTV